MITRAIGRNIYIRVEHGRSMHSRLSPLCVVGAVAACVVLILALFFMTGVYEETRGQFMERLEKEKELIELNKALKMELAAVTQKGYMEFVARERLGLKQADDKEVVVLR